MFSRRSFLSSALLSPLVAAPSLASAQAELPYASLPQNPNISVRIIISGQFQQLSSGYNTANLELLANVASYGLNEPIDPVAMDSRLIAEFTVPDEAGWGYFAPVEDLVKISFAIRDTQNRLGKIVVRDLATGQILKELTANATGSLLSRNLYVDWDISHLQIEGISRTNAPLFKLGSNRGFPDTVVPVTITGRFRPHRPPFIASPNASFNPCSEQTTVGMELTNGTEGDPRLSSGTRSGLQGIGITRNCAFVDYVNDIAAATSVPPPGVYASLVKGEAILDTASAAAAVLKVKEPASLQAVLNRINEIRSGIDASPALTPLSVVPYSEVTCKWTANLTGQATAVLVVPYEKVKKNQNFWSDILSTIAGVLTPKADIFSVLVKSTANQALENNNQLRQQTNLKPNEVMALGDIYVLSSGEYIKHTTRILPVLKPVAFKLEPDIMPPSGTTIAGVGTATALGAWTNPSPLGLTNAGQLSFDSNRMAQRNLASGYNWRVTGQITQPPGYVTEPAAEFQTPTTETIIVRCKLTVLIRLRVITNRSCRVKIMQGTNVVASGNTETIDGKQEFRLGTLSTGNYTIEARYEEGQPPIIYEASTTIAVVPAAERIVELTLKK